MCISYALHLYNRQIKENIICFRWVYIYITTWNFGLFFFFFFFWVPLKVICILLWEELAKIDQNFQQIEPHHNNELIVGQYVDNKGRQMFWF